MKIVIDIDDKYAKQFYKNKCKDKFDNLATNEFGYVLREAFENATPLPEHHGRLIDANKLHMDYCNDNCGERKCVDAMDRCVFIDAVLDAPTIIEGSESE